MKNCLRSFSLRELFTFRGRTPLNDLFLGTGDIASCKNQKYILKDQEKMKDRQM